MPNWCENSLTISGPLEILKELEEAQLSLQKLFPCPKELLETSAPAIYNDKEKAELNKEKYGHPDWYSWQVANWGTKWDLSIHSIDLDDGPNGKGYLTAGFDTAWSPPVEAIKKIFEKYKGRGLKIEMEYFEPGCSFIGKVTANDEDDFFDEYYDYSGSEDLQSCIDELGGHDLAEHEVEYLKEREEEERQEKEAEEKAASEAKPEDKKKSKASTAKPKSTVKKATKPTAKKSVKKPAAKKVAKPAVNPLTLVKIGSADFKPTFADLEAWRNVFEEAQYDKDFKVFTHEGVAVERVGYGSGIYDISGDITQTINKKAAKKSSTKKKVVSK